MHQVKIRHSQDDKDTKSKWRKSIHQKNS